MRTVTTIDRVVDPQVRAALERALDERPNDASVRLHLAQLIVEEDPQTALSHCIELLAGRPDDVKALGLAAVASRGCGEIERAEGYERLCVALSPDPPSPDESPPAVATDTQRLPAGVGIEDEAAIDAFLTEVLGDDPDIERPMVTLEDVGGLDDVKRRLHTSFLGPMRNPELRRMYGKSLRGGLLLYGPPGCGKTFLARAVAGELGAHFFGIGLHDVLDMWLGESEKNLHKVFETARRHTPCVLFLDEVDALGLKRSNLAHSAGRNVVVQLLTELDSTRDDNEGVFVLGATNQPWDLDPGLRRPGRFDRMLLVLPPDPTARAAIIEFHLRDRPVASVDVHRFARATDGYSGADLRLVCEAAAERALEDSLTTGRPRPIDTRDFDAALRETKASTRPWFDSARNYAMFANDGGPYDELIAYMRRKRLM